VTTSVRLLKICRGPNLARRIAAMSLKVFSCCAYSTLFDTRNDAEWNALQFVRAIKRKPLRGYGHVPLPDGTRAYLEQ
jgi:hypothetical protein